MSTIKYTLGPGVGGIGEGNISLKGVANFETGGTVLDAILSNPNSPCYVQEAYLANGVNTFNLPNPSSLANCAGVLIIPPITNLVRLINLLAADGAGTGIPISRSAPTLVCFDATPPASIKLNWTGQNYQNTTVTLDGTNNRVNLAAHGLVQNEAFKFVSWTTGPTELALNTTYYVQPTINVGDFQFSTVKDGAIIDFTGAGTGTIKLSTLNNFKLFWF